MTNVVHDRTAAGIPDSPHALFAGPGEARALCRAVDWCSTSLGAVENWPVALRAAVHLMLDTGFPSCVYAGPDLLLLYNDRFAQVLGLDKHPFALGRPARECWSEIWTELAPQFAQVFAERVPIERFNQPFVISRNGASEESYWNYALSPIRTDDGTVVGVVHVATETTALVVAERATRQELQKAEHARALAIHARLEAEAARTAAERANRSKSDFLAVMSHELRTPLHAIGGYIELLTLGIRGPLTEEQRRDLGRIGASQRHLVGLINELLDHATIENGSTRFSLEPLAVRPLLEEAEMLISLDASAKGIRIGVDGCAPELEVVADGERVRQILVNLLTNALKFTEPGGQVEIACHPDGEYARITVSDTGIGISADQLVRIFEPFVQVRSSLPRTPHGVGLGLSISRDLARAMAGDLTVESTPGEGSVFTLSLPLA